MQERQPSGGIESGCCDFEVHLEFLRCGRVEVEAVRATEPEAEIKTPAQFDLHVAIHVEGEPRQSEIEGERHGQHIELSSETQVELDLIGGGDALQIVQIHIEIAVAIG